MVHFQGNVLLKYVLSQMVLSSAIFFYKETGFGMHSDPEFGQSGVSFLSGTVPHMPVCLKEER